MTARIVEKRKMQGGDKMTKYTNIEYMCKNCGRKSLRTPMSGRPMPGECPRNNKRAHVWVINRKW